MEEISPGIFWINGGASNMFLCRDDARLTLIDAGMPKKQQLVFDAIQELGSQPVDLAQILVTHADIDHVGSLAAIQAESGAAIYAGQQAASLIKAGKSPQHLPRPAQFIANHFFHYQAVTAVNIQLFADNDTLPFLGGIQVLASPGHTPDHFSFYCPQSGVLFAGDALDTRKGRINRSAKRITADQIAANQSALRLLELAPAIVACGHGTPLTEHTSAELMRAFNAVRSQ